MTSDMDTKPGDTGEVGDAKATDSGNSGETSEQRFVTVDQFNELQETLRRQLQSQKDKAVAKTNERVENLESTLTEVLQNASQKGMSVDDLLKQAKQNEEEAFRQDVRFIAEQFRSGGSKSLSGGSETGSGGEALNVIEQLGLDRNDVRVADFATKQFASAVDAYAEGAKLLKNILTSKPTDADLPTGDTRRQGSPDQQAQLLAEYKEGSKDLRGRELINFKMKMRKRGLNIS